MVALFESWAGPRDLSFFCAWRWQVRPYCEILRFVHNDLLGVIKSRCFVQDIQIW